MRSWCSVLLVLPGVLAAATGTVSLTLEYAPGDFVFDETNGYDVVVLPGEYTTSSPGEPCLPLATYNILIPPDAEVVDVEVTRVSEAVLPGEYDIHPCQRPQAFSLPAQGFVPPDESGYSSDKPYPAERVAFVHSGLMGGFRLAAVQVAPLRYAPARRELMLATRLTVEVRYERGRHGVPGLAGSQVRVMAGVVEGAVANPERVSDWAPHTVDTDDWTADMVVVTSAGLAGYWRPYVDWKTRHGIKTFTARTDSIYANSTGRDNQEKIRNFIIDLWQNHGLTWVIIGGDEPVVPVRTARIICEGSVGDIATDLYYADLQGSWDSNRNNLFGEMSDSMDFYYDLFIGRAPVDNADNVANFIAKCTTYTTMPDTGYLGTFLFGSTSLFPPFHGRVINRMIGESYPGWRQMHLEDPPSNAFRDSISAGAQLGHVAAHGSQTSFSVMSTSHIPGLSNGHRKLNFLNSIACNSGWFDGYECIAESLVNCRNGGCVANMFNSRYGYGYPPGFGPSEMLDLEFYRYFAAGAAHQFGTLAALCKDRFRSLTMGQEVWRWCVYELNLFGDPSLPVWSQVPGRLSVVLPDSVMVGTQVVLVRVSDNDGPVEAARVCLMKGGETYARGWTDRSGIAELLVSPATTGDLAVTVNAHDFYPYEAAVPVRGTTSAPALVFTGLRIDDGGNGRLDPGESADLYVSLANLGASPANAVAGRLQTPSPWLTIVDSTAGFGSIPAGDTVEGEPFAVTARDSTPPGTLAELDLLLDAGGEPGYASFATRIGEEPPRAALWLDHDTGEVIMSVTSVGSIGTLGPYREGTGFKYPRDAAYGSLYFTSFAASTGPGYAVDRWYGNPSSTYNTDWAIAETLRPVEPPIAADEEYAAVLNDSAHPSPRGLFVSQWSGALADAGHRDFVVISYVLQNRGAADINDLYCGIFSDFDINNSTSNRVFSDTARRLTWMAGASGYTSSAGIVLLSPEHAANQSAIDHMIYVDPSGMMTEAVKDSFLRGWIRLPNSNRPTNWSMVVSAGPFNLAPGASRRVSFAFVGGESQAEIEHAADSALSWYEHYMPLGLTHLKHTIDDPPPGGNGDGILNPGESINLPLWVVNRADGNAHGVSAILRKTSADTLVTVTDSVRWLGNVPAGDSVWTGSDGFKLRVAEACTNGYALPVVLVCVDTLDSSFVSSPGLVVGAPQLVPSGVMCWDPPPGGNNNGRLDPGEEADLALGLQNIGLGHAENIVARLASGDARLVVLDPDGGYGTVPAESTVFNSGDRFRVRASATIPRETQIPCTLHVTGDEYQATRTMLLDIGVLTSVDPVPDGPRTPARYYAYDDVDTFYVAAPEFAWVEVAGIGTRLTLSDDQTVRVDLPPEFGPWVYYGEAQTQVSVCGNGFVVPGYSTYSGYSNQELPYQSGPAMVAANWDDLYPPTGNGVWHYHDAVNHRFVIEWDSVHYYSPRETWDKFEIVVYDTTVASLTSDNRVEVQYLTANRFNSATVGLQDPTASIAIQCLYNGDYHRAAAQVLAGRAIRYTTDSVVTGLAELAGGKMLRLALATAPNPVLRAALVRLSLPQAGMVRLAVLDVTGRVVRTLAQGEFARGVHEFRWDRTDDAGRRVTNGVYLYQAETAAGTVTRKAVLVR